MSTKLFVGNMPFSIDKKKLEDLFSLYGKITECMVIIDRESGRSKGFGFVTFADKESADKAIAEMNGKDIEGREIKVNEAKPFEPTNDRPPRRNFGPRRDFGDRNRRNSRQY